ncbi:MAG: hypothetical protein U5K74_06990 [Gemmatimonadaceae bacterium]|nr:hypothetical protein [Gemmatimonadaceae bacterium]
MISVARIALAGMLVTLSAAPLVAQAASTVDRPQFIRVVAKDYVYDAPATVQSGIATIHLVNQGTDIHHVTVQELPSGKSVKDFFDATRTTGLAPTWSRNVAQTGVVPSGGEAFLAFRMPPGRYILSCLIPAADGRSHVAKGMYQLITATINAPPAGTRR